VRSARLLGPVAALAVGLGVGLGPAPAGAHPPQGQVSIVGPDGTVVDEVDDGQELTAKILLRHTAPDAPFVQRVDLELVGSEVDPDCPVPLLAPAEGEEAARQFERVLPAFECNGTWLLLARGTTGDAAPVHGAESGTTSTSFSLAVRPRDPAGLEAATAAPGGTPEVTLTWLANPELDLVGYRVERLDPGAEAWTLLGTAPANPEPTFVDDELVQGGEHAYRLTALRVGATAAEADQVASAGSDMAATEVPEPPATTSTTGRSSAPQPAAGAGPGGRLPTATVTPRTPTTRDTGFRGTLPFDPSQTTTSIIPGELAAPAPTAPPVDDAVVAIIEEPGDDGGTDQLLVPVAAGLALLVGGANVRHVVRRAGEADEVIVPL